MSSRGGYQLNKENKKNPISFIFSRGNVSNVVKELVLNIRKIMIPNIVENLHVKKYNKLKDLLHVAGPLGVTYFWICTQSEFGVNLRLMRIPNGPSLTFRIEQFSLIKDVISFQKRPGILSSHFNYPLVILNNFSNDENHQIISIMFQNIFPTLKIKKIQLSQCDRACLFDYDRKNEVIQIRHYNIKNSVVSLNHRIKNIVQGKKIPNLKNYADISEYFEDFGYTSSDSGVESFEEMRIILPNKFDKGNINLMKSSIRLKELGPRLTLKLLKIENKIKLGKVLYERYETKLESKKKG